MAYPSTIDAAKTPSGTYTGDTPNTQTALIADLYARQIAVETELGTVPKGSDADVKTRLNRMDNSTDWTSFTPSWTGFTLGNGSEQAWYRYDDNGDLQVRYSVAFGSTTSIDLGVGLWYLTVPDGRTSSGSIPSFGKFYMTDATGLPSQHYAIGTCVTATTSTTIGNFATSIGGGVAATNPWTWTTSDEFAIDITIVL